MSVDQTAIVQRLEWMGDVEEIRHIYGAFGRNLDEGDARLRLGGVMRADGDEHYDYVRTADDWKIAQVAITRIRVDPLAGRLHSAFDRTAA